jgi:hypothetical protein
MTPVRSPQSKVEETAGVFHFGHWTLDIGHFRIRAWGWR